MSIFIFLKLIGCLALLMYGMKVMSEGLQKMAGSHLRHVLGAMTTNRVTGLFTGAFITAAIQSSTATTVMTVSFVNAGLLTLVQAISVIMGANIGTTFTAWIMSAGFNFNIADYVFPMFAVALAFNYSKKRKSLGEFIFGLCFLFFGLGMLRQNAVDMDLGHNQMVLDFFASTGNYGFLSILLFLLLGSILTMCVQSSAAIMAITMILCSQGVLPIYQGIALVMGENIGTTVTSNIAALTANTQARRAAFAHMFFNLFGVFWVLICFKPFVNMVCSLVGYDVTLTGADAASEAGKLTFVLATFHTAFNVCNVLILIWFIKFIEKLVCRVIVSKNQDEDDEFRLNFISGGILSTAELSVLEAQKEINNFAVRSQKMFGLVRTLMHTEKQSDFNKLFARIEKYEGICDNMEVEIANYLNKVSEGRLSDDTKQKIRIMLREITEIESIGDSCFNLARTINHCYTEKKTLTEGQLDHVHQMFDLTDKALSQMMIVLKDRHRDVNSTYNIENEINNFRTQLKTQNIIDVNDQKYDYQLGVHYMDIILECEKLGDYVVNVVEARTQRV